MKGLTVVLPYRGQPWFEKVRQTLFQSPVVRNIFLVQPADITSTPSQRRSLTNINHRLKNSDLRLENMNLRFQAPSIIDGLLWNRLIGHIRTGYLLLIQDTNEIMWSPGAMERLLETAETTKAGMVYSDYYDLRAGRLLEHPVNDYQSGSIRDDFHFGPVRLISVAAARSSLKKYGAIVGMPHAGLYDLRLKMSMDYPLFHLQEYLYTKSTGEKEQHNAYQKNPCEPDEAQKAGQPALKEQHFAYVDPRYEGSQKEMEAVATAHLKRIGAWLQPVFRKAPLSALRFPVEASVIIPVKNRRRTIAEAVQSALSQETDFSFNVICVDNHSTDGTTSLLARLARKVPALNHLIPRRTDLGIGGCWNEAIHADCCGRYAVQLDSDDLYSGPDTLQRIVDLFRRNRCAVVIGAYTIVNEKLEEIPPGRIDHREWTDENGRNNALRINGLGAPRAFQTALLRQRGFLNVSYGEDYEMVLRLLREHRLGRIYDSLYLCRRWEGNTDAGLTVEQGNRNDAFKDKVRTLEILARQALNKKK
jgi:GT2 family glycosyltransferase